MSSRALVLHRPKKLRRKAKLYKASPAATPRSIPNQPFPPAFQTTLTYVETVTSPSTIAGAASVYLFRANSCYDPNYTGAGHQPLGFDQWMAFYNHYTVVSSSIEAHFNVNSETVATGGETAIGVALLASNSALTDLNRLQEAPQSRWKVMPAGAPQLPSTMLVRHHFDGAKFFNVPYGTMLGTTAYSGDDSSNPTEDSYFELFSALTNANSNAARNVTVTIRYKVVFTEVKLLTTS
jgi:hypothetical protein